MRIVRTQWPVGQGCFATGRIEAEGSEPLHYVYDCGARNVRKLPPIVESYAARTKSIDALFVSHLDGDHVDGLDRLLAEVKATTVFLPYLTVAQRIALVLEEDAAGRLSGSLIQAQLDPATWFGDRGVERIVLVTNTGESPEGGFVLPEDYDGPRPEKRKGLEFEFKGITSSQHGEHQNIVSGGPEILRMMIGGALIAKDSGAHKWLLVPWVPYVDPKHIQNFQVSIRGVLGLTNSETITAQALAAKLRDKKGRSELRGCYDEILNNGASSNHNKVSMSLYSGPYDTESTWDVRRYQSSMHFYHRSYYCGDSAFVGWIGAGDAELDKKRQRLAWTDFYRQHLPQVGTMLLPHHGSHENWHRDLLNSVRADLFVAAADEQNKGYKHPSPCVVDDIYTAGRQFVHVTRRPDSRLEEIIEEC